MARWTVLLLLLVVAAVQVEATFASSAGFSGRSVDCTICHAVGAQAAQGHLDGVPDAWRPGETYELQASVTGGPLAAPDPQPKGGFELEVEAGRVAAGTDMQGLLRFPAPTVATYEPAGTLRRDWAVTWTAPPVHEPPGEVTVWLAVLAANGNHVIATNTSDGGEQGDSVDTLQVTVPAAPDVVAAWEALPLEPPVIDRMTETSQGIRIQGHHADGNATHLAYRLAEGPWKSVAQSGDWSLLADNNLRQLEVRSEGTGRISPPVQIAPGAASPLPLAGLLLALLLAAKVK